MGVLKGSNKAINVINVYAPQNVSQQKSLWDDIGGLLGHISGWWVILGDFNAICCVEDRLNSKFNKSCGYNFNNFINDNGLREFEMKGKKFTFHNNNNGNKHSNIDRVLVCQDFFFSEWPVACLKTLLRVHSDHCPLVLICSNKKTLGLSHLDFLILGWTEKTLMRL
ncbi:putative endonuclease/exonuclease/phosphatase [Helianthus annuus]|nr:putative endonuclease/exonuclease/phosphatase [Helianthus annuus]